MRGASASRELGRGDVGRVLGRESGRPPDASRGRQDAAQDLRGLAGAHQARVADLGHLRTAGREGPRRRLDLGAPRRRERAARDRPDWGRRGSA